MSNVHGFSPQQLVLGYNTYCPGLDDEHISLSQIENVTPSKIIADNLNAMYEARSAFLRAHNSERLKRALKGRVYKVYETKYFIGDSVYYKTGDKHWKGPGTVIGQHKKLVLVKTGGSFVRVYPNRLILKTDADKMLNEGHQISIEQDSEKSQKKRILLSLIDTRSQMWKLWKKTVIAHLKKKKKITDMMCKQIKDNRISKMYQTLNKDLSQNQSVNSHLKQLQKPCMIMLNKPPPKKVKSGNLSPKTSVKTDSS